MKELDPKTVTAEELAQAGKSLQQARWAGVVVGVLVALVAWSPAANFMEGLGYEGLELAIVIVASTAAYRLTYEILTRILPPH